MRVCARYDASQFHVWARMRVMRGGVIQNVRGLLEDILPSSLHSACVELEAYLLGSLGHPVRIDYGTGHETSFVLFLRESRPIVPHCAVSRVTAHGC